MNDIRKSFEKIKAEEELKEKTKESVLKKLDERPKIFFCSGSSSVLVSFRNRFF